MDIEFKPGDVGGVPQLVGPVDLTGVDEKNMREAAIRLKGAGSLYTVDQIVSMLKLMQTGKITLTQENIDNIAAGRPVLTKPLRIDISYGRVQELVKANPWLKSNPVALFYKCFMELAAVLQESKLIEGQMAGLSILDIAELAHEAAKMTIKIGKIEAFTHFVAAGTAAASAAATLGFAAGGAIHARYASKGGGAMAAQMTQYRYTQIGQGFTQLFTAVKETVDGVMALKKSKAEALKTIIEAMMKIADRKLAAATEAYRTLAETLSQLYQLSQKVADERAKASIMGHTG